MKIMLITIIMLMLLLIVIIIRDVYGHSLRQPQEFLGAPSTGAL